VGLFRIVRGGEWLALQFFVVGCGLWVENIYHMVSRRWYIED